MAAIREKRLAEEETVEPFREEVKKAREERKRKGLADNTKTEQETGFVCPASAESDEDDDYYREAGSKVPSLGLNRK